MSSPATILRQAPFEERLAARELRVGIVGLGYAGLPLALAFAEAGFAVVGIDRDGERVNAVNQRRPYLVDVPAERYEGLRGELTATSDYDAVRELDALTICVPTPLTKTQAPDLSALVASAQAIGQRLQPDQLVVLQSTTYPGTTTELLQPALERDERRVGRDFYLGYAPERVDPGNPVYGVRNTPKLTAGATPECQRRVAALYATIVDDVVSVRSPIVAELAKLHENTFRAVNIALANELALMCEHLSVSPWEVIDAAATKPFAFMAHYPGPGLGGDCIPVVPHFLSWRLRAHGYRARLIDAAHDINSFMPGHVVRKVADELNERGRAIHGSRILVLGAAYKPDVQDTRESPARRVIETLRARGGDVGFCDPLVGELDLDGGDRLQRVPWTAAAMEQADCVVLITAHTAFLERPHWQSATLIVDTRNVVPDAENVRRL